jgi:anti-sigma B factor antagonist
VGQGATHEVQSTAGGVVVRVAGEIDLAISDDLRRWLVDAIPEVTPAHMEVDLSQVTFLDSTGIRALVLAQRAAGDRGVGMRVSGAQGKVESVLKITGVYALLTDVRR